MEIPPFEIHGTAMEAKVEPEGSGPVELRGMSDGPAQSPAQNDENGEHDCCSTKNSKRAFKTNVGNYSRTVFPHLFVRYEVKRNSVPTP